MRTFAFMGVFLLGLAQGAGAADLDRDYLRGSYEEGPVGVYDWSGFYAGVQAGYSDATVEFGRGGSFASSYASQTILSGAPSIDLADTDTRGSTVGGFVGFNTQWEDAVVGFEANYTRSNLRARSTTFDSFDYAGVTYSDPTGLLKITDYAVFRGRAGYAIGHFLPYATVGFAVGRGDTSLTLVTSDSAGSVVIPGKKQDFAYGYAVGGGVDVALLSNVFARAEYEFVSFDSFSGATTNIHNVRGAIGVKFW